MDLESIISEGKLTARRILKAAENLSSSDVNSTDPNSSTMSSSRIIELNSTISQSDVQPCATPTTSTRLKSLLFQSFALVNFVDYTQTVTTDNVSSQLDAKKHVMISYNRATATATCQKIYDRLRVRTKQNDSTKII